MKILVLAHHYPPSPEVGAQRPGKLVNALLAAGHTVTVVAATTSAGRDAVRSGVVVRRVEPLPTINDAYLAAKHRWQQLRHVKLGPPQTVAERTTGWTAPVTAPYWRRLVNGLQAIPDEQRGFILPALKQAIAAADDGAQLVISTAPPFSVHVTALLLNFTHRLPWIADFRDPWTERLDDSGVDSFLRPDSVRTDLTDRMEAWLERRTLEAADRVVCASEGISARLKRRRGTSHDAKIRVILNGIDEFATPTASGRSHPFRIVHAGTCYMRRDPRPFLNALAGVCRRRNLGPGDVHVDMLGDCRWFHGTSVEAEVRALGLEGIVQFRDRVPKGEAQRAIDDADLLLLLAQGQPIQVPYKLYDYLGAGRRILAFTDGETAAMLERVGGHIVVSAPDPARCEAAVDEAVYGLPGAASRPDHAVLEEWSARVQMERYVGIVEDLAWTPRRGSTQSR